jgi:hypothetical protein
MIRDVMSRRTGPSNAKSGCLRGGLTPRAAKTFMCMHCGLRRYDSGCDVYEDWPEHATSGFR